MEQRELFIPTECWLVSGENESDDLSKWKANREFVNWDQEWFEQQFVHTGEFIDSDSDSWGCGGGSLLLFRSKAAADLYGTRDAAIASDLRKIEPAIYIRVPEPCEDDFPDQKSFDEATEAFSDFFWSGIGLAAFHGSKESYLVFSNDEVGRQPLQDAISRLKSITRVEVG